MSYRSALRAEEASWLTKLSLPTRQALLASMEPSAFAQGQTIFDAAAAGAGLHVIESGVAALMTETSTRESVVSHFLPPGAWFGASAMLTGTPRQMKIAARTDLRTRFLPKAAIERIATLHPDLWRGVGTLAAQHTALALEAMQCLMHRDPADRCRATLARLARACPLPCTLPIRQSELADLCMVSRGTLAPILADLEDQGVIIRGYREIRVLSLDELEPAFVPKEQPA